MTSNFNLGSASTSIRIGARQSALSQLQAVTAALWFSNDHSVTLQFRESLGDINQTDPLWKMPEKGVFTSDFRNDLLNGRLDCVVHSYKDLPTDVHAEDSPTVVFAHPERADSRDILVFKKDRVRSRLTEVMLASSSPRREYCLSKFLSWALPGGNCTVRFQPIRGNVQTRLRKLAENPELDGLVMAKAALDRFLNFDRDRFASALGRVQGLEASIDAVLKVKAEIQSRMQGFEVMVLPHSENPTAASQGALAFEVSRQRQDLIQYFQSRGLTASDCAFEIAWERDELRRHGGGCHQKIGVSRKRFEFGDVISVRGFTDAGQVLHQNEFVPRASQHQSEPLNLSANNLYYGRAGATGEGPVRTALSTGEIREAFDQLKLDSTQPVCAYVTRKESWVESSALSPELKYRQVWVAGVRTWKALARQGVFVNGTTDSLGDSVLPQLSQGEGQWLRLTHQDSIPESEMKQLATYRLEATSTASRGSVPTAQDALDFRQLQTAKAYFWMSASQFERARARAPEILEPNRIHASGPGATARYLAKFIPKQQLRVALDIEGFHQLCGVQYEK